MILRTKNALIGFIWAFQPYDNAVLRSTDDNPRITHLCVQHNIFLSGVSTRGWVGAQGLPMVSGKRGNGVEHTSSVAHSKGRKSRDAKTTKWRCFKGAGDRSTTFTRQRVLGLLDSVALSSPARGCLLRASIPRRLPGPGSALAGCSVS